MWINLLCNPNSYIYISLSLSLFSFMLLLEVIEVLELLVKSCI